LYRQRHPPLLPTQNGQSRVGVIVQPVTIQFENDRWVVLELYKSTILVLPRAEFEAGLKRGKAWRRAAALRARLPQQEERKVWHLKT
ncbi:MAG: hypothetical protein M3361_10020, partial [Candidatus Tectomicrobia bacterium]|nr:hypothetical protein [Candidatus Tectomicrobia bacterium]